VRRNITVIIAVFMVSVFLLVPVVFAFSSFNAVRSLQFSNPQIHVSREGWNLKVSVSVDISNPTNTPVPSFTVISKVTLNGHILFDAMQTTIGDLDPGQTMTLVLSTTLNIDLMVDLISTLLDYLSGKTVDYYVHFSISAHLLFDFPVFSRTIQGKWSR